MKRTPTQQNRGKDLLSKEKRSWNMSRIRGKRLPESPILILKIDPRNQLFHQSNRFT
jgi:hypothetical protein